MPWSPGAAGNCVVAGRQDGLWVWPSWERTLRRRERRRKREGLQLPPPEHEMAIAVGQQCLGHATMSAVGSGPPEALSLWEGTGKHLRESQVSKCGATYTLRGIPCNPFLS